jgi:phytoene dehydrogenase-like protein
MLTPRVSERRTHPPKAAIVSHHHQLSPLEHGDPARVDVIVIGGGLAGLTAATYAARSGARVAVLESTNRPGGRARTDLRDGVSFNQGPHALYEGGHGITVLHELGIDPPGGHPNVTGPAVRQDREGRLPFDARSLATTKLLRPSSRLAFARFHTRLGRLDPRSFDSVSVAEFLDDELGTERADLRALVEGIIRLSLYANSPELHSAGAAIDQLVLARSGVRYLHQGWGALVASLASAARGAGADLHTGTTVEVVEHSDDGWTATDSRGRRWSASAAILAGLSPEAAERLSGREHSGLRAAAGPAVRAACLDLVLQSPPKVTFAMDLDHHGYYSVHAPVADLATEGRALLSLARYRRPDETPDAGRDRATLRDFARRMGVQATLAERYLHDMTVAHGMPLAARGGLAGRPRVDSLGNDGVLLAGDWVGPTGLLSDASLTSGRTAGRLAADIALASRRMHRHSMFPSTRHCSNGPLSPLECCTINQFSTARSGDPR